MKYDRTEDSEIRSGAGGMKKDYHTPLPDDITPEEMEVIQYHRNNIDTGSGQRNDDGSETTFYGSVVTLDTGTPDERAMIIPTYWHGKRRSIDEAMEFVRKSGIPFPTYPDEATALAREKTLHDVMDADGAALRKTKGKGPTILQADE